MRHTVHALGFLVKGPIIVAFLFLINLMTGGPWWVQWPALGIGIAWVFSLMRVLKALVVVGGLAGLVAYLNRQQQR